MIRVLILGLLALGAEAVRLAVLARLPGHPDPLLGMTVLVALYRPAPAGALTGFLLGLIRDVSYGQPLGMEALPLTLVGWGVSLFGRSVYRDAFLTQFLVIAASGLVQGAMAYALARPENPAGVVGYMSRVGGAAALSTAVLVPVVWRVLQPLLNRLGILYERKTLRHGR